MKKIVFAPLRVLQFVQGFYPLPASEHMVGIGLEEDGQLSAGVIYEGYNGQSVWMHVAAVPGRRWMTRDYLRCCFDYPFNVMNVNRISGWVEADNMEARRFDENLGFKHETTLSKAGKNGTDVMVYVMWKDQCRFIGREVHRG